MHLRLLLLRLGSWLNRKLNIISDDPWYDWADQRLDGLTNLTYEQWLERRNK